MPNAGFRLSNRCIWTIQAVECWEVSQDCRACSVGPVMSGVEGGCHMPEKIQFLLEAYGEPNQEETQALLEKSHRIEKAALVDKRVKR